MGGTYMVVKEITEDLIQEAIQFLPHDEQKVAYDLHELSKSLKLKIGMRRNLQKAGRGYCIEYSTKKPNRMLFIIKTGEKYKTNEIDFRIKANLFHIEDYRETVEESPSKIKESIKSTAQCGKCNPVCYNVKSKYTLDGVFYDPCYIKGHHFENLNSLEWSKLKQLIIEEYKANTEI
jgi:rubrerythrin